MGYGNENAIRCEQRACSKPAGFLAALNHAGYDYKRPTWSAICADCLVSEIEMKGCQVEDLAVPIPLAAHVRFAAERHRSDS